MKKLTYYLLLFITTIISEANGQSLTPQVYAANGTHYSNATGQLSFTIGEPLTSTYSGASYTVTQGFHQPERNNSGIDDETDFAFTVFPNPSQDFITISTTNKGLDHFTIDLVNNLGELVRSQNISGNNQKIDLSTFAAGTYHLRINYLTNKTNSFTIIKTTNQ